jgi:hypothetical protein
MADAGPVGGHNCDGALRCLVAAVILAGVIQVEIVHGDCAVPRCPSLPRSVMWSCRHGFSLLRKRGLLAT